MGLINEAIEFFDSVGYPCRTKFNPADHFITELSIKDGSEDICREKILQICKTYSSGKFMSRIKNNIINIEEGFEDEYINFKIKKYDHNRCGMVKSFRLLLMRALLSQVKNFR